MDENNPNTDVDVSDSSDSESNDGEEERSKKKINSAKKFCLFINETGHSLRFALLPDNLSNDELDELSELMKNHMGIISIGKKNVDAFTAVLVADDASSWNYSGDAFKLSYIHDCISAGRLLNISQYLKLPSKLYTENFDYMNVIYFQTYSWQTVPGIFKLERLELSRSKQVDQENDDSDDSLNSIRTANSCIINLGRGSKHSKTPYSRKEKEAILRYIVERDAYASVKGKRIYRDMEAADICPIRTWQSMKDHCLRILSKEVAVFSFLTRDQKQKLKRAFMPCKN